jgi:hypothetical protein
MIIRGFSDAPMIYDRPEVIGYPSHDRFMTGQFSLIIYRNIGSTATDETQ